MKRDVREVYVADDGTVFNTEDECLEYETNVLADELRRFMSMRLVYSYNKLDEYHVRLYSEKSRQYLVKFLNRVTDSNGLDTMFITVNQRNVDEMEPDVWYIIRVYHHDNNRVSYIGVDELESAIEYDIVELYHALDTLLYNGAFHKEQEDAPTSKLLESLLQQYNLQDINL